MTNRKGVSIVEITVVIAILAIFAMVIYPIMHYSSVIYTMDSGRSALLEKTQYAMDFMEREIENAQRITIINTSSIEFLRNRPDLSYKRIFEGFSFDPNDSVNSRRTWLRFRKGVNQNYYKIIDGVTNLTFTGYKEDGTTVTTDVNSIYSVEVQLTVKDKYNRCAPVTLYGRATLRTHHNLTHMYIYYDSARSTSWVSMGVAQKVTDFFTARGFTAVKANDLKKIMVKSVVDKTAPETVVVMSQDVVPDKVALKAIRADTDNNNNLKTKIIKNDPTNDKDIPYFCIIRQFMNAGGRVVWYGDIPFYYYDKNGTRKKWGEAGSERILGIAAWTDHSNSQNTVSITNFGNSNNGGYQWGLSYKWKSVRPTYQKYIDDYKTKEDFDSLDDPLNSGFSSVLAYESPPSSNYPNSHNYAAAYFKNFDVSHPGSGFVRIFDRHFSSISIHILQDIYRVATFETTFYIPFKKTVYYDKLFPSEWIDRDISSQNIVEYFHSKGYFILDAQQLQAFMQNAIFYNTNNNSSDNFKPYSYTVVVMSKDIAPDTVANVEKNTAIIRRYLNKDTKNTKYGKGGNGRVIWLGYIPFYYQGHFDNSATEWYNTGSQEILGFDAGGGDQKEDEEVTITSGSSSDYGNGKDWGLSSKWDSALPEEADPYWIIPPAPNNVDEILAYYIHYGGWFFNKSREVSAWFKQYGSEKKGGFVRIWDYDIGNGISQNDSRLNELKKVSEYKWP